MFIRSISFLCGVFLAMSSALRALPSLNEVLDAKRDLWGEAAMRQANGASYEFFKDLLPPPRYVNADFRYYPIVLSAPNAKVKARLISNGSGVNLRGGNGSWNDLGAPVTFRVGPDQLRFGDILQRLSHPRLEDGYLPIVQIDYAHPTPKHDNAKTAAAKAIEEPEVYRLEAFATTDPILASNGVVFMKFSLSAGSLGFMTIRVDEPGAQFTKGRVINTNGEALVFFDRSWNLERRAAKAKVVASPNDKTNSVILAIATKPLDPSFQFSFEKYSYDTEKEKTKAAWLSELKRGAEVETPEPLVNNAWRNLVIQDFALCLSSNLNYSHGNQYQKMYAAETSDAAFPLMSFGFEDDMRRFLPVILDLHDRRLTNHFAAHKLDALCRFYWQTRDIAFVKSMRPRWQRELDWILSARGEKGLLPKDNYCTDIEAPVFSFSSNASCWAALRDIVPVLEEIGDHETAARVAVEAAKYKENILHAAEQSIRRETQPPFIPCALFGAEDIHDPITETRIGSYWDLVANYSIGSGIFRGGEKENWIPEYFETHGGLCMGLTRSAAANHTFWIGKHRTNPLYGMRYVNDCLRRDDVERALVNFYGMLAHGMTRNTFIGAEGTAIQPLDQGGRQFYCPPNTASNGEWLWTLRHLLVQDFDMDNDGRPDVLRLAFGTPKRWLEHGKSIRVLQMPTAFGPVSYFIQSELNARRVVVDLDLPSRNKVEKILFRARVPDGWKVQSAKADSKDLPVDHSGAVDLSGLSGKHSIRFSVAK